MKIYTSVILFFLCIHVACVNANDQTVKTKMLNTGSCLGPPYSNDIKPSGDDEKILDSINEYVSGENIQGIAGANIEQFKFMLDISSQTSKSVKNYIIIVWTTSNGYKYYDQSIQFLSELLDDNSVKSSQYIEALNVYTVLLPYSDASIKYLKSALKREDLTREQRFYIEARLAVFDVKNSGLSAFDHLIKNYPDKKQCVAICGEQIALEYHGNRCNDLELALKCYTKVFEVYPEMSLDCMSLLGYTNICRDANKPSLVLSYLEKYIKENPTHKSSLDILWEMASIYMSDLKDFKKAAEYFRRIVEFDIESSPQITKLKNIAAKNLETCLTSQPYEKNHEVGTLPEKNVLSWWRLSFIVIRPFL